MSDLEKHSIDKQKNDHGLDISTDSRFIRDDSEGVERAYLVKSELGERRPLHNVTLRVNLSIQ